MFEAHPKYENQTLYHIITDFLIGEYPVPTEISLESDYNGALYGHNMTILIIVT